MVSAGQAVSMSSPLLTKPGASIPCDSSQNQDRFMRVAETQHQEKAENNDE